VEVEQDLISNNKKVGVVTHTCHLSYVGSINRRIAVQAGVPFPKKLKQRGLEI
jgi:hypothetical protein